MPEYGETPSLSNKNRYFMRKLGTYGKIDQSPKKLIFWKNEKIKRKKMESGFLASGLKQDTQKVIVILLKIFPLGNINTENT